MKYSIVMTPDNNSLLTNLLALVRAKQAEMIALDGFYESLGDGPKTDEQLKQCSEKSDQLAAIKDELRQPIVALRDQAGQHDLFNELNDCYHRFIDPFCLGSKGFTFNPEKFGDFLEELLDPEQLEKRHNLVNWSLGFGVRSSGYLNDEVKRGNDAAYEQDSGIFDDPDDDMRCGEPGMSFED